LQAGGAEIKLHAKQTDDILVEGFVLWFEFITSVLLYLNQSVLPALQRATMRA
jgi:hypothetical protein